MIFVIDNYDSFTYNLVQYLGELGARLKVFRNDKITVEELNKRKPAKIIISPGPGTPKDAGVSCDVISAFYQKVPILGVCLGHQCIGEVFGAKIVKAKNLMHGKTSDIYYTAGAEPLFANLKNPFQATRYHSLIIKNGTLPKEIKRIAWTKDGEIMGVKHRSWPLWGVQFHPESILTFEGKKLLKNFLKIG